MENQSRQRWRTFEQLWVDELKFVPHPMDPRVFMLRELMPARITDTGVREQDVRHFVVMHKRIFYMNEWMNE